MDCFTRDLVGHTMVNLEVPRVHLFTGDHIARVVSYDERFAKEPGERLTSTYSSTLDLARITKSVRSNSPARPFAGDLESIEWHPALADISRRPRWMVVSVQGLKLLGGDVAMLQDMVDYSTRTLGGYLLAYRADARVNIVG